MADLPFSATKKVVCSKCNAVIHQEEAATTGAFSKGKIKCFKCNFKHAIGATSSLALEKKNSKPKQFMEKINQYAFLPNWLRSWREARLQKQTNDKINKQLCREKRLYMEMQSAMTSSATSGDDAVTSVMSKLEPYQLNNVSTHYRLLLVGSEESGKTTIIKQMRILYGNGFTSQENQEAIREIQEFIRRAILEITDAMKTLTNAPTLQNYENYSRIEYLQKTSNYEYSPEFFENIKALWEDKGIQAIYQRRNE